MPRDLITESLVELGVVELYNIFDVEISVSRFTID